MEKIKTVCFIRKGDYILLGLQKDDPNKEWKKGVGLWNGLGGKVEAEDASIEAGARREVMEEARVEVPNIRKVGIMYFRFDTDGEQHEVHIFDANGCVGDPVETKEMIPQWFHVDDIPYDKMFPADRHWMPFLLAGKQFKGRVLFGKNGEGKKVVLEWEVELV